MINNMRFGARSVTPESNDAAEPGSSGGTNDQGSGQTDFRCDGIAWQAAMSIEGEDYARAYVERLQAGIARPGELAVLMSFLTGELLYGACRLIEKALEGHHHA